ncbi:MAG: hypothetical protein VX294_15115 [Candidatus Latescibacterota bacterium]|nr:hypothetical protein [Candidatus Latescibacterota bacterium]
MLSKAKTAIISLAGLAHLSFRPSHWRLFLQQFVHAPPKTDLVHLASALQWLCQAHDKGYGGVSAGYSFLRGWLPPYPETTGYIIPTMLRASKINIDFAERARKMGDWEIEIQLQNGGVRGGMGIKEYPIVFNTGQVILGWTALYHHFGDTRYLAAAKRAADWLIANQDKDGKWSRHTYLNAPRAYHARVAWPLLEIYKITNQTRYKEAANNFLSWLLPQQKINGFFPHMSLDPKELPITHTIAYTLRGLIECARLLDDPPPHHIQTAVDKAIDGILKNNPSLVASGHMAAALNEDWEPSSSYSCLTGNAQLAIILLRSPRADRPERLKAVRATVDRLKYHHNTLSSNKGICGGLPASFPIWGDYIPFTLLNWSTKFLVDLLLEKIESSNNSK